MRVEEWSYVAWSKAGPSDGMGREMGGNDRGSHVGKHTQAHHGHAYGTGREGERHTGDMEMHRGRSESYKWPIFTWK